MGEIEREQTEGNGREGTRGEWKAGEGREGRRGE